MRHKRKRGEVELGFAGLALLRSYPPGARSELISEISEKLKEEGWADYEVEIDEFDIDAGYRLWAETYDGFPNPLVDLEEPVIRSMIDRLSNWRRRRRGMWDGQTCRLPRGPRQHCNRNRFIRGDVGKGSPASTHD